MRTNRSAWQKRSTEDWQRILVFTDRTKLKAMGAQACSKTLRPRTKTPGAFLNNAKRWPGYGRTSGMRCVIVRAEPVRDLNSPAEGSFLEPFFISTQLQAALLSGQRALSGYSSSFSVISLNLFSFWRYLQ
jgi:hypothetical protein